MPSGAITFSDVLNKRLLVVPDYQRPYAWEEPQLRDLWDDLDLMGDGAKHYTGTLVLKDKATEHETDSGEALVECDVVDGQQRATTCLILIDRLRRAFERLAADGVEAAADRAAVLQRTYGLVAMGGQSRARLRLGEDFNDYWSKCVLADNQQSSAQLSAAERRLSEAASFFSKRIQELMDGESKDEAFARLKELQRRVTNGLRFLVYEVEPESHAGEIFETLNGRGRDLTELDKIKNYLLFLAESLPTQKKLTLVTEINRGWSRVHEHLAVTSANEDLLLRAHWLATKDPYVRNWKGSPTVKGHFQRDKFVPSTSRLKPRTNNGPDHDALQQELVTTVLDYVDGLQKCALFTAEFLAPGAPYQAFGDTAASARGAAGGLRRTGITAVFRPLLFATRLAHPSDGAAYTRIAEACERYAARVFIMAQRRSNAGQAALYSLAHELYAQGKTVDDVIAKIDDLAWYYADDQTVRASLAPHVNWYVRSGHKYVLYEYELSKSVRRNDVADFETYTAGSKRARTTEHVLPQNPDWTSSDWSAFTKEQHELLVNGLANLALTDDNSSYGRKPFIAKKGHLGKGTPCYAESRLVQERELATVAEWTPDTMERRREELMEWALARWKIDRPADESAAPLDSDVEEDDGAEDIEDAQPATTETGPHDEEMLSTP